MTKSKRTRIRQETITEIKRLARSQIASDGAASLSLGAIARELDVTTPALYRYFTNRNELVTTLIVEAFHSLADTLIASIEELGPEDVAGRFYTLLDTYRSWAIANSGDYTLILGAPIAGYKASPETMPAALRNMQIFATLLQGALEHGQLTVPAAYQNPPPNLVRGLEVMRPFMPDPEIPTVVVTLAVMIWIRIHGLVWMELHGHLPPELLDSGELFHMEISVIGQQLGLI